MTQKISALIVVLALLCLGCENKSEGELEKLDKVDQQFQLADSTKQSTQEPVTRQSENKTVASPPIDWDKKIVKTAHLDAEVKDFKVFSKGVNEKIKKHGGYISGEQQKQTDYKIENSITIKVPVAQFEHAVNDLLNDTYKINDKRITSDDVTTELIDGKSRLEAKKQVRLRYLDLLKQAKNMEEILTVQKEINGIQEDIETVSGRINSLGNSSAMSTIHFSYSQILDASAIQKDAKDAGFLTKVKNAFSNGWYWIGEIFVGIISIWPLILFALLGYYLVRRKIVPKLKP